MRRMRPEMGEHAFSVAIATSRREVLGQDASIAARPGDRDKLSKQTE